MKSVISVGFQATAMQFHDSKLSAVEKFCYNFETLLHFMEWPRFHLSVKVFSILLSFSENQEHRTCI